MFWILPNFKCNGDILLCPFPLLLHAVYFLGEETPETWQFCVKINWNDWQPWNKIRHHYCKINPLPEMRMREIKRKMCLYVWIGGGGEGCMFDCCHGSPLPWPYVYFVLPKGHCSALPHVCVRMHDSCSSSFSRFFFGGGGGAWRGGGYGCAWVCMHEINYDVDVFCLKTTFIVHFTKDALFKTFSPCYKYSYKYMHMSCSFFKPL